MILNQLELVNLLRNDTLNNDLMMLEDTEDRFIRSATRNSCTKHGSFFTHKRTYTQV